MLSIDQEQAHPIHRNELKLISKMVGDWAFDLIHQALATAEAGLGTVGAEGDLERFGLGVSGLQLLALASH